MELTKGIPIDVAVEDMRKQIKMIRRKTTTLIDYYIFPEATPSEIAAYDPRLEKLDLRLAALDKVSYSDLGYLIDDSDAFAAAFLIEMIDQLLNAIHGINELFINHYDRRLKDREPFGTIYKVLEFREDQLKETRRFQVTDPRNQKPEDRRDNQVGNICRGAIQMINDRDRGEIGYVADKDLLAENRARLEEYGGAYLWWKCTSCEFRLRYHLSSSAHSSIHSTQEVRAHAGVKAEYKSTFLVKSHLYHPSRRNSRDKSSISHGKYGCVFCVASGKSKITFSTGRQLATHVADNHRGSKKQPAPMLLEKFNVGIKGKLPENVRRWDVNLL